MSLSQDTAVDFSRYALFEGKIDIYNEIYKIYPFYTVDVFMNESEKMIVNYQEIVSILDEIKEKDEGQKSMIKEMKDEIKKLQRVRHLIKMIT